METVWKKLRTLRKRAGLTQQQLSAEINCSRQEISLMEMGKFRGSFRKVNSTFQQLGHSLQPIADMAERTVAAQPHAPSAPIRILAIDDDPEVLHSYRYTFQSRTVVGTLSTLFPQNNHPGAPHPYQIDNASSGEEGVKKWSKRPAATPPTHSSCST